MIQAPAISQLSWRETKTYGLATLFIAGNILLPQLCHLIPQGGLMLLPIYFFTLIGAYKYGLTVGLLTAVLSPIVNNLLFGMPPVPMLPAILVKSIVLALAAALIASRVGRVTLLGVALAVLAYQGIGTIAEWAITGSAATALHDIRIGFPGILIQVFGGWAVLSWKSGNRS